MEGTLILLPAHWIFFEASHQQTKLKLRYSCRSITAFLNAMLLYVCMYGLLETDPYLDRATMITGRGSSADELPEFSPTYVAFSTLGLVILTIFTNVMFNLYVKPSVDGVDPPERIQRESASRQSSGQATRIVSAQCTAYSFVKRYVPQVKRDILLCGQWEFASC